MYRTLLFGADTLKRHATTLEQLHAHVATARRIGIVSCGSALVETVLEPLAHTFGTVPGRSVSVNADPDGGSGHNADVVLTDLGAFTTLPATLRQAARHHALCIVTTTERQEADPTLALADVLADRYGVNVLVACVAPTTASAGRLASRWTKLIAKRRPERLVLMTEPFAHATLAGMLLETATRTPVLTGVTA